MNQTPCCFDIFRYNQFMYFAATSLNCTLCGVLNNEDKFSRTIVTFQLHEKQLNSSSTVFIEFPEVNRRVRRSLLEPC